MPTTRPHHAHEHANATITLTPNANEVSNNMGPAQTTPAETIINTSGAPPITNTSGAPPITSTSGAPPITNTSGVPPITQNTEPSSSETVPLTTTDGTTPDVTEPRNDKTTKEAPQSRAEPLTGPDAAIAAHQPSIELDNPLKETPLSGMDNTTQNVALTPGHLRFTPRPSKPSNSYQKGLYQGSILEFFESEPEVTPEDDEQTDSTKYENAWISLRYVRKSDRCRSNYTCNFRNCIWYLSTHI